MWDEVVEKEVRLLYQDLSGRWNRRDADGIAELFEEQGSLVGFDGDPVDGRARIAAHLKALFAKPKTPAYAAQVEDIRLVTPEVAVLRAVAGIVLPGGPAAGSVTALQTLVAAKGRDRWAIALFHSSPALGHEGPEAVLAPRSAPAPPPLSIAVERRPLERARRVMSLAP